MRHRSMRQVKLSPGPMHNAVGWNPETDIPDGNRIHSVRKARKERPAILAPDRGLVPPVPREPDLRKYDLKPVVVRLYQKPDVLAGVYRAIAPVRQAGEDFKDYLARPLMFRLVDLKFFPEDATQDTLFLWLDEVQTMYFFGPEEVFVIRNRVVWERVNADRLKSPYTPGLLARRARRLA